MEASRLRLVEVGCGISSSLAESSSSMIVEHVGRVGGGGEKRPFEGKNDDEKGSALSKRGCCLSRAGMAEDEEDGEVGEEGSSRTRREGMMDGGPYM